MSVTSILTTGVSPFLIQYLTWFLADRVQKLKDARTEASKEIEEYKKTKEQEFKAFEASVRSDPLLISQGH